jgi:hypothetical protein
MSRTVSPTITYQAMTNVERGMIEFCTHRHPSLAGARQCAIHGRRHGVMSSDLRCWDLVPLDAEGRMGLLVRS